MESVTSFGEYAPMQTFLEDIASDCARITAYNTDCNPPFHPLRSHSRKHRSVQFGSGSRMLDSPISSNAPHTRSRLRRTQAFSDLQDSDRPSFAPVVSVSVSKDSWLEESVAKAKSILVDKESAEDMAQQLRGVPSIEYLNTFSNKGIRHKNKLQDLRSDFASDEPKPRYLPPVAPLLYLTDGQLSPCSSGIDATSSSDTVNSDTSCFKPKDATPQCVCYATFSSRLDEMALCSACEEWFHVGCASRFAKDIDGEAFYCSGCLDAAFRAIAEEEEAARGFA